MVKPRVYGAKYLQAVNIAKSGEPGPFLQTQADKLSTADLYLALKLRGWAWDASVGEWVKERPKAKRQAPVSRTLFGDLPVSRHLAVRVVTQTEKIDSLIEATTSLYALADCTLIKVTGPVVARKGKGKSMAYLYFALPS